MASASCHSQLRAAVWELRGPHSRFSSIQNRRSGRTSKSIVAMQPELRRVVDWLGDADRAEPDVDGATASAVVDERTDLQRSL